LSISARPDLTRKVPVSLSIRLPPLEKRRAPLPHRIRRAARGRPGARQGSPPSRGPKAVKSTKLSEWSARGQAVNPTIQRQQIDLTLLILGEGNEPIQLNVENLFTNSSASLERAHPAIAQVGE
jgi:hypothetical protein